MIAISLPPHDTPRNGKGGDESSDHKRKPKGLEKFEDHRNPPIREA
ncbi:MAG: hypothetical protein Q8Q41_02195 [bacterium]|nr:hypothetical protein [bacterium]